MATNSVDKDKRKKLSDMERVAIVRHLLAGERISDIAAKYGVHRDTVHEVKSAFWDAAKEMYESGKEMYESGKEMYESGTLKREVAAKVALEPSEVDAILRAFGDPLDFTPQETTLWPSFGIDERFGQRHPGNIPALLVKNLRGGGPFVIDPGVAVLAERLGTLGPHAGRCPDRDAMRARGDRGRGPSRSSGRAS